jgi:formate/nitrite transporter FocA (FNT family)
LRLPDLDGLTWASFLRHNLLPVTLGNLIGGTLMVGALYRFVYLRRQAGGEETARS